MREPRKPWVSVYREAEWMCVVAMRPVMSRTNDSDPWEAHKAFLPRWASERWQSFLLVWVQMLIVCGSISAYQQLSVWEKLLMFSIWDCYRASLPRLANPHSEVNINNLQMFLVIGVVGLPPSEQADLTWHQIFHILILCISPFFSPSLPSTTGCSKYVIVWKHLLRSRKLSGYFFFFYFFLYYHPHDYILTLIM